MWMKHVEIEYLSANVSGLQRHILCRPYEFLGLECNSIVDICKISSLDPEQKLNCETDFHAQEINYLNSVLLDKHEEQVSNFIILRAHTPKNPVLWNHAKK